MYNVEKRQLTIHHHKEEFGESAKPPFSPSWLGRKSRQAPADIMLHICDQSTEQAHKQQASCQSAQSLSRCKRHYSIGVANNE